MENIKRPNHRPYKEVTLPAGLNEEYYTTHEVADLLKVNYRTVTRMISDGRLKAIKIGNAFRIRRDDLENAFK